MEQEMLFIGRVIGIGLAMLAVACWFGALCFGVRAIFGRKPGVPFFSISRRPLSPWRAWEDGDLTPKGVDALDKYGACLIGVFVFLILAASVALITGAFAE